MNKDNAAQFLPLVQALADGKTIQYRDHQGLWKDGYQTSFVYDPEDYRIKPTPREWTAICSKDGQLYHYTNGQTLTDCQLVRVREILD
jgi:hypothetical protein